MPTLVPADYRRFARTLGACALSYCAARLVGLPELYWAVITTLVVVTQPSLNQALATGRDQIIGAVIGAIAGGIGLLAILRGAPPLLVFAIELVPLAALAALRPTLRLACVTLVIVVLIPGSGSGVWPFERPIDRVLEILIGACAALAAAFIVPNRAINTAHQRASDIVMTLGELIAATLKPSGDRTRADQLHRQASSAESALDDAITEAGREHIIVPVKRTRGDIVDKAAPMLKRLHRDALFLGQAFGTDASLRPPASPALDTAAAAFEAVSRQLASTLDTDRSDQETHVKDARDALERLKTATHAACESMEKNTVPAFVLALLVQDFADLVALVESPDGQA